MNPIETLVAEKKSSDSLLSPQQNQADGKSISSSVSGVAKFAYTDYPSLKPTNPIYSSTTVIKTTENKKFIGKSPKYNPLSPPPIIDWRCLGIVSVLFFFPTGLIALGLAMKAQTKFRDGFINDSKRLNRRAFVVSVITIFLGFGWILGLFFGTDKWPRTYG